MRIVTANKSVTLDGDIGWSVLSGARPSTLNAYVFRCIQLRVSAISSIPIVFEDSGEDAGIPSGILRDVEASLLVAGAAYLLRPAGKIGWRVINPKSMRVEANSSGISAFVQTVSNREIRFKPEQIVYIRYWHPDYDLLPGLAPLDVAKMAAETIDSAEAFTKAFFEQGALPPMIVSPENGMITEADKRTLEEAFRRVVSGVRNAWKALVLRGGIDVKTIEMPSLANLAMSEVNEVARARIAVAFGIPQTMIEDAANYATAREHRISFWRETIIPEMELIISALNDQHFARLGKNVMADYNQVEALQQDEATKASAVIDLFTAGIISRDEARRMMDIQEPEQEDDMEEELRRWQRKSVKRGKLAPFRSAKIPSWLGDAIERLDERGFEPFGFVKYLDRKGIEDIFAREEERIHGKLEDLFRNWLRKMAREISDGNTPTTDDFRDELLRVMRSSLQQVTIDSAIASASEIGINDIDAIIDLAIAWVQEYTFDLVKEITETTARRIAQAIEAFRSTPGMTVGDVEAMLEPTFGAVRAQLITTTEITRAYNQGVMITQSALEKYGLTLKRVWQTASDDRVCDICGPRDGAIEGSSRWDGEPPPAHPGCRCWTTLEVRK